MLKAKDFMLPLTGLAGLGGLYFLWQYLQKKKELSLYGQSQFPPPGYQGLPGATPGTQPTPGTNYGNYGKPAADALADLYKNTRGSGAPPKPGVNPAQQAQVDTVVEQLKNDTTKTEAEKAAILAPLKMAGFNVGYSPGVPFRRILR